MAILYEPMDLAFGARRAWSKPFVHVRQIAEFQAPSGRLAVVEGFYDGGATWRVRFSPDEPGRWSWRTESEPHDEGLHSEGAFDVTREAASHGFLRATPGEAWGFHWSDGSPAFLLGDTMYNLAGYVHSGHDAAALLERRLAQGMDLIRVRAQCSSYHRRPDRHSAYLGLGLWPWGGIPQAPDFEAFNLSWFATMDGVVRDCQRRGISLELILEGWMFEFPFNDRHRFTAEDEELWIRYLVARYAAYRAIAIWTPGNEYVYYPDGEPPLTSWDEEDTKPDRWLARLARLIRSLDPHARPIAAHTMLLPRPTFAERLQRFPEVDTILFQEWGRRDEFAWTADGIDQAIGQQLKGARQSVVLAEYGYESIEGLPSIESRQHMSRDHTRRGAWRAAFCGMLAIAGFENTWGPYMQLEPDAPGAADLIHLRRFLTEVVAFALLRPADDLVRGGRAEVPGGRPLALASPNSDCIVAYLPVGGEVAFEWPDSRIRQASWFNPRSGAIHPAVLASDAAFPPLDAEAIDDWVIVATAV